MENNETNIIQPTPFQHFTTECFGTPVNPMRESRIKRVINVKQGKSFKFSYYPKDGKKGVVPKFNFTNSSGLMIDTFKKTKSKAKSKTKNLT